MVIEVTWTVAGKSSTSAKARRAVPQGQATPGISWKSTMRYRRVVGACSMGSSYLEGARHKSGVDQSFVAAGGLCRRRLQRIDRLHFYVVHPQGMMSPWSRRQPHAGTASSTSRKFRE